MFLSSCELPEDVLRWMRVATHIHTQGNSRCSGQQTPAEVVTTASRLGFEAVVLNEHTGDPAAPRMLEANSPEVDNLIRHRLRVEAVAAEIGYDLRFGLETNSVAVGSIRRGNYTPDLRPEAFWRLSSAYTVGSLHGDTSPYKSPRELVAAILALCNDKRIDALGHITRYVSDVGIDWRQVGQWAAQTGTAVELNLNLMFKELGQNQPKPADSFDGRFHRQFLKAIADSGARVAIGLDVHNAGMWPGAKVKEGWETSLERVRDILDLIVAAGFTDDRVINSSRERFDAFVGTTKSTRA